MKDKLPLKVALFWILLSVLLISGTATLGLLYYQYIKELHAQDEAYRIVAIVQTTTEPEALKTVYLAELLDISVDKPTNLYRFNSKEATRKLLGSPLIKDAQVKKIRPGTLYIDYVMRKPIAFLADFTNTAIDSEGYLFPYKPFFTPKKLPEIYLGISSMEQSQKGPWGICVQGKQVKLALSLLQHLNKTYCSDKCYVTRIDVSKANALSCGQREIVAILEVKQVQELNSKFIENKITYLLRLNSETYSQGLANFALLQQHLFQKELLEKNPSADQNFNKKVIDLRLPQLAFIQER